MKTCLCNVYLLEPHFYVAKRGYAEVYLFFLFLLQNIDCGYLLELPPRGGPYVYTQYICFREKYKVSAESFIFLKLKILCLSHGQVCRNGILFLQVPLFVLFYH